MKRQKRLWTAAAACAVLGAACRAVPGVRFAGLLFWCLTALLIVFAMLEQYKEHAWAKWGKRVLLALVCLGLVAFGYLESLVIRGAHTDGRAEDAQCVVILGAGVNGTTPSLMLSSRLQAALDFIADKPDIPIILQPYLPIMVVAALDALLGAARAYFERSFSDKVFVISFISNVVTATLLVFLGNQLGVGSQLQTAVIVVLGIRIFSNVSAIRRFIFRG